MRAGTYDVEVVDGATQASTDEQPCAGGQQRWQALGVVKLACLPLPSDLTDGIFKGCHTGNSAKSGQGTQPGPAKSPPKLDTEQN
jgi:hypothetical protein